MGTVKSEQAKDLTLERRRGMRGRRRRRMCKPTYVYQGNDDSTIIACNFVQVPSFHRNPLPLSSRFMT
jgi:hypothetical protein